MEKKKKKCCQGALEGGSWQELSHGMMRGLNQLSSTVRAACTLVIAAALIGTQGQVSGGDTQNVLWLHLHDGGGEGEGGFTA